MNSPYAAAGVLLTGEGGFANLLAQSTAVRRRVRDAQLFSQ